MPPSAGRSGVMAGFEAFERSLARAEKSRRRVRRSSRSIARRIADNNPLLYCTTKRQTNPVFPSMLFIMKSM